jgi:hypothetical protein
MKNFSKTDWILANIFIWFFNGIGVGFILCKLAGG